VVWYRVRNAIRSWAIFIIVLIVHGIMIYLLLVELVGRKKFNTQHERIVESTPVYFTNDAPAASSSALQATADRPTQQEMETLDKSELKPESEQPLKKDELLFASLYQKATEPDETETENATDSALPEPEPEKQESPIADPLTLVREQETKEKPLTPDSIAPKKVSKPPKDVVTDDEIPMAFEGVHTTQLSTRDSLFHTFIKAVNTSLYAAIKDGTPPFTPGIQPIVIRLVIVRTGKLAQRPTVVRSSGNASRDAWYIDAIIRASASFPTIPDALRLPFAEMYFKEGSKGIRP
jgi:hypothetical protein